MLRGHLKELRSGVVPRCALLAAGEDAGKTWMTPGRACCAVLGAGFVPSHCPWPVGTVVSVLSF